jgi:hypothetical protein
VVIQLNVFIVRVTHVRKLHRTVHTTHMYTPYTPVHTCTTHGYIYDTDIHALRTPHVCPMHIAHKCACTHNTAYTCKPWTYYKDAHRYIYHADHPQRCACMTHTMHTCTRTYTIHSCKYVQHPHSSTSTCVTGET